MEARLSTDDRSDRTKVRSLNLAYDSDAADGGTGAVNDENQLLALALAQGCPFSVADFRAFVDRQVAARRKQEGELADEQLAAVAAGGTSQEAFDILVDHGDELTFYEQVACVYVWLTGGVMAGPDGQGDYRPGGETASQPGFGK